jgi:hypothetical protein
MKAMNAAANTSEEIVKSGSNPMMNGNAPPKNPPIELPTLAIAS